MADSRAEGQRQGMLEKKRKKMMEEFEKQKEQISKDNQVRIGSDKFAAAVTDIDSKLKTSTVGLFELNDFRRIKEDIEEQQRKEAARTASLGEEKTKKKKKKNQSKVKLSFAADDDEEQEEQENDDKAVVKKPKFGKDPNVNTSFLPDREREEMERIQREELRQEWLKRQEEIKDEVIEITYSYWDGSGHRKTVECKKGDTISRFLDLCRQQIHELRSVNVDNLLYIKEDLIIPHHYTFYDFIINKARGKSGPLFNFDVHDDVRLVHDATVEKDESHAGKVVERSWYEKNKHIFPASRWEVFDPEKNVSYSFKFLISCL
ncbi:FAM50A protein [Umbelopsis sp. PMI_123]|nr:FAM50A protein [Umbelopsis sp. PMI_123]